VRYSDCRMSTNPTPSDTVTQVSPALAEPVPPTALPGGDELAEQLMAGNEPDALPTPTEMAELPAKAESKAATESDDEIAESNKVAETLTSLQNLIERYANELNRLGEELKHKRESLKSVFENDTQLGEAEAKAAVMDEEVKTRRMQLQTEPQVTSLKVQISEMNDQKKEIEETLSNHLVSYHQITNSTSFDTSDGDQWDFAIKAKIKARKNRGDE
jgi:vacuolar-type H+-ATPase subunit I/STV1